ncbi:S-adenosylmethionine decarboxylase related protein [Paenibacillus sp. MBLB4367]|uniref:S-adenosylmethionine decarboxylase related protein n=1 Tax=Paenibacillus sp. MBLB4367 TaxID=3384767 RepID=UPI0039081991
MPMRPSQPVLTLLGSAGGVAKAVLSILHHAAQDGDDPIHGWIRQCRIHLVDYRQKNKTYYNRLFPHLKKQLVLHQFDLHDLPGFREHLRKTGTQLVIDVSWADTVQMIGCCNELGVAYVNTALENTAVDDDPTLEGFTLLCRSERFETVKNTFSNLTAIVGSGMNPGVVQWMAIELMRRNPDKPPKACYIVEHDTTFFADASLMKPNSIYTTWSPECFLDEALLNYPMFMQRGTPLFIYDDVYAMEFRVRLGDKTFTGCLMPHEEVISLSQLFGMETGFIYRVSEQMTEAIRRHLPVQDDLWEWDMQVLDPTKADLIGEDTVGVLLVYDDKETYMLNALATKDVYPAFPTNATYYQVACGVYGAVASVVLDTLPKGVYYVDELLLGTNTRYGEYVSQYMKQFITGENAAPDGLLLDRMIVPDDSPPDTVPPRATTIVEEES